MTDPSEISAFKASLPRTWHVIFARFGQPTPIQQEGIPAIFSGRPTLLVAPTASGKTEAFIAPVAEQMLAAPDPGRLTAWIVSPTRALVNDLGRRLTPILQGLGLSLGRRTGEHRELDSKILPHLVITTPESLDSILSRSPSLLLRIRHLILDEIHLLDATPRGDQLACLVSRIKRIAPDVQVIASSATVEDPDALALRYLDPEACRVSIPGGRPIRAIYIRGKTSRLMQELRELTGPGERGAQEAVRKVLVFVRSRAEAERLSVAFRGLPPFGDQVFLHHGSLSRTRREEVERRMLQGTSGICFATSTLEVGIDIGDIDLIVLHSPVANVSAVLQRIGRGNRRRGFTRVCCLAADDGQQRRYEHLIHAASEGQLLGDPHHFDPSVLVQQCLSLLMQTPSGWISAGSFRARLPAWLDQTPWPDRLPELLDHLCVDEWLISKQARYYPGERLLKAFEQGKMHTNIRDDAGRVEVVDRETMRVLGVIPKYAASHKKLVLGGRKLRVRESVDPSRILVTDTTGRADLKMPFARGPLTSRALARDFARFITLDPNTMPIIPTGEDAYAIFHFLGSTWSALWTMFLGGLRGITVARHTAMFTIVRGAPSGAPPEIPTDIPVEQLLSIIVEKRRQLISQIPAGPWFSTLPQRWQQDHLITLLEPEKLAETLRTLRRVEDSISASQRETLRLMAASRW